MTQAAQSAATEPSPPIRGVSLSQLLDIGHYRLDAASFGMIDVSVETGWTQALDRLCDGFAGYSREMVAFSVFAAYVARMSENREGTIGFATRSAGLVPLPVALTPEDGFEDMLRDVGTAPVEAAYRADCGGVVLLQGEPSLVVQLADEPDERLVAEIAVTITRRGELCWRHSAAIDAAAIRRIQERMTALANGIAGQPLLALVHQPIMSDEERHQVVRGWNDTARDYGYEGGLVAMMEREAARNPQQPATIFKGETLTYAEFNARANRLARVLRARGVGKDCFVALCMERSHELIIALWATIKAGGAYVPLNTEDPEHRIAEIIEDCRPKVVLTQAHIRDRIVSDAAQVIVLPEGGEVDAEADGSDLGLDIGERDLAYMIYTSGSTGKPKGVIVEHVAIHNRVVWMHEEYGLSAEDRVLQKTPYTFDVSVWEFLWPFAVGSTLVIPEPGGHMAMGYLARLIRDERVTHLHFVPSILRSFVRVPGLDTLGIKKLFCSGEALPHDLVQAFYEKSNPEAEVHNLYGPTEAAVDVSYWHCPRDPADAVVPIGRPIANTGLYVLDEFDRPSPIGVPGELHIGGINLARGYHGREDLTAEKFIECPVEDAAHDRLYRTGDLAYFRPDGEIVYLGRNDFQVKINGVRMELGEIEAAIREQGGVDDVVVMAEERNGNKALIAYVVGDNPSPERGEALKGGVAATRPVFYVPKEVHFIAGMPLTSSGKTDRKALSAQPKL